MKAEEQISVSGAELVPVIREVLAGGAEFVLTVTGYSMMPTLKHQSSEVRLVSPSIRAPEPCEIVFFQRSTGEYVLHRITGRKEDESLIIKGDAQNWTECIEPGLIIGVVDSIRRGRRWISCDAPAYRVYVKMWVKIKPLRTAYFLIRRTLGKIRGIMKHWCMFRKR